MPIYDEAPPPGKSPCRLTVRETPEQGIIVAAITFSTSTDVVERVSVPPEQALAASGDEQQIEEMARAILRELPEIVVLPVEPPEWMVPPSSPSEAAWLAALMGQLSVLGGDVLRAEAPGLMKKRTRGGGVQKAYGEWWGPVGVVNPNKNRNPSGQ